jgi:GT2 family glycosyltransferase
MKASVLIHNLNRASILEHCLASVAEQTYRPLEVILLDAGSTDESLSVIDRNSRFMLKKGIEVKYINCSPMGVAASRNYAARQASGELFCVIDNDATFASFDCVERIAKQFRSNSRLAIVSTRIVNGDSDDIDAFTWVYRRSKKVWSDRQFKTFTFTGGGFCVRAKAFWEVGGFWDHLKYSREEEELSLALVDKGWELVYFPEVVVRHYSDPRGRSDIIQRRYVELRNGLLILWRRLPLPLAIMAISARICTMSLKMMLRDKIVPTELMRAVVEAKREWRESNLKRIPVSYSTICKYVSLHFRQR